MAIEDAGEAPWSYDKTIEVNETEYIPGTERVSGKTLTEIIVSKLGNSNKNYAAYLSYSYNKN